MLFYQDAISPRLHLKNNTLGSRLGLLNIYDFSSANLAIFLVLSLRGTPESKLIDTLEINLLYTINYYWLATQIY